MTTQSVSESTEDRVTYDGDHDHLGGIVVHNAFVQIERLDTHRWMIHIRRPETVTLGPTIEPAVEIHLEAHDVDEHEIAAAFIHVDDPRGGVCHEWTDPRGIRHQCHKQHTRRRKLNAFHKCGCGAIKQIPPGTSGRPS